MKKLTKITLLLALTLIMFINAVAFADDEDDNYGPFIPTGKPRKKHHYYAGIQGGYTQAHMETSTLGPLAYSSVSLKQNSFTGGANVGYRFSRYLAAELGYQFIQGAKVNATGTHEGVAFNVNKAIMTHAGYIAGRLNIPIVTYRFQIFLKLGGVFVNEGAVKTKNLTPNITVNKDKDSFNAMFAGGAEYFFTNNCTINVSYMHFFGSSGSNKTAAYDLAQIGLAYYLN